MSSGYYYLFLFIGCDVPTYFLKFAHIVLVLALLSSTLYCTILIGSERQQHHRITFIHKILFFTGLLAALTGTLLVHPRHFTFHTPWIQAAYILFFAFFLGVLLAKKRFLQRPVGKKERLVWQGFFLVFLLILIFIVHDAVTKTTFLL